VWLRLFALSRSNGEDGNRKVRRNFGKSSPFYSAESRKPNLYMKLQQRKPEELNSSEHEWTIILNGDQIRPRSEESRGKMSTLEQLLRFSQLMFFSCEL
jgi:hypothetical protein